MLLFMTLSGGALREARERRGWTQAEAAARLGVSQPYIALLEQGRRPVPGKLARKAVEIFKLSPAALPITNQPPSTTTSDRLARDLGRLGYPGFTYLRGGRMKNPAEVLLAALAQTELDSRVAEALPWLLLRYPRLPSEWLLKQVRLLNLSNRLGFIVDLARRVVRQKGETESERYRALTHLADSLRGSRLAAEDTFGQPSLSQAECNWLRTNRPPDAKFWRILTNWQPEHLPYLG